MFLEIIIVAIGIILTAILLFVLAYRAAENNQQATFVREGTIKFIVAGETLVRTIENIKDYHLVKMIDGTWELRREEKEDREERRNNPRNYLEREWGFYWVSLFYPMKKVHRFTVIPTRLKPENQRAGKVNLWIESDSEVEVSELLWKIPRPILCPDIEFEDNFGANILVYVTFEVTRPYIPVFILKKEFFQRIEASVKSQMLDICKGMSYAGFIKVFKKSDGDDGLLKAFASTSKKLEVEAGVKINSIFIVGYDSVEAKEIQDALKASELAKLKGDAEVVVAQKNLQIAELEAKKIITLAEATAKSNKLQLEAVGEGLRTEEVRAEAIKTFRGQTLVLGNTGTNVNVGGQK